MQKVTKMLLLDRFVCGTGSLPHLDVWCCPSDCVSYCFNTRAMAKYIQSLKCKLQYCKCGIATQGYTSPIFFFPFIKWYSFLWPISFFCNNWYSFLWPISFFLIIDIVFCDQSLFFFNNWYSFLWPILFLIIDIVFCDQSFFL